MERKKRILHIPPKGLESMCRVCTKSSRNLTNIFDNLTGLDVISEVIMECAPVQISPEDNLPHHICNHCITKLQSAHQFRTLCLQSDITFRQYNNHISRNITSDSLLEIIVKEETAADETANDVEYNISYDTENAYSAGSNDESNSGDDKEFKRPPLRLSLKRRKNKILKEEEVTDEEDNIPLLFRFRLNTEDTDEKKIEDTELNNDSEDKEKENKLRKTRLSCKTRTIRRNRGPYKIRKKDENGDSFPKLPSCDSCKMTFANRMSLARHLKTHSGEKPFSCEICHKRFATRQYVKGHMIIHTEERKFSCDVCGKTFMFNNDLKVHIRKHTGEKPYVCEICAKGFVSSSALCAHKYTHGPKRFFCIACSKGFTYKQECDVHVLIHRNDRFVITDEPDNDGMVHTVIQSLEERGKNDIKLENGEQNNFNGNQECTVSSQSDQNSVIDTKTEIDMQNYPGDIMGIKNRPPIKITRFDFDQFLTEFERVRSTSKSEDVTCDVCSKVLSSVSNLYRHKMIHKGIKKHTCEICNKSFKWKADLQDHKNRHLGIRKIQCEYCSKMFTTKSDYGKHVSTHMDHKPFVCDVCSKSYYNIYALNHHKKVHMHPYKCEHPGCCSSYPTEEKLARHMKTHDDTKRKYQCNFCEKEITTTKGLMRHIRTVHVHEPQPLRITDEYESDKNSVH